MVQLYAYYYRTILLDGVRRTATEDDVTFSWLRVGAAGTFQLLCRRTPGI